MKLRPLGLLLCSFLAVSICAPVFAETGSTPPELRQTYNFNLGWRVERGDPAEAASPKFDDAQWKAVTLPYAWNEDDAFRKPIHEHTTGIAWYRKHFTLPADAKGKKFSWNSRACGRSASSS